MKTKEQIEQEVRKFDEGMQALGIKKAKYRWITNFDTVKLRGII